MTSLSLSRAEEILERFPAQRILVVGDLMLDRYIYGRVERISPEAPVPVVEVTHEQSMPGGAGNVASNVRSLGGRVAVCGVVGVDAWGDTLLGLLRDEGVDTAPVVQSTELPTTVKTRVIAEHQQVVRVDREKRRAWSDKLQERTVQSSLEALEGCTGLILEDYGKGVIRHRLVNRLLEETARRGLVSGLDPKEDHDFAASSLTVATPNRRETHLLGTGHVPRGEESADPLHDEDLLRAARRLMQKWSPRFLAVTLGAHGMLVLEADAGIPRHIPARAREVYDVSGAGDTVIAACILALAAGASPMEAAEIANFAAGVVVGKLGTATCSRSELLDYMREQEQES